MDTVIEIRTRADRRQQRKDYRNAVEASFARPRDESDAVSRGWLDGRFPGLRAALAARIDQRIAEESAD